MLRPWETNMPETEIMSLRSLHQKEGNSWVTNLLNGSLAQTYFRKFYHNVRSIITVEALSYNDPSHFSKPLAYSHGQEAITHS